ncbi:caveolin-2 [Ornithorhynchus anatinus]|uniref:Caveolin n=1 Tax=Ornithorhynchus anatinus TaxID=9258 RepID=F6W205_ORNAN|nr:caveolin-2 [Ornithorhynchus anatinus]
MLDKDILIECKTDPGTRGLLVAEGASLPQRPPCSLPDSRDPQGINQHLKVDFADVLAEPTSFHSFDRVWTWSDITFETSRLWGYRLISLLCALPGSLLAGGLFACLSSLHIWCIMPCVQLCMLTLPPIRTLWISVLDLLVAPLCASVGRCCSFIRLTGTRQ